MNLFQQDDMIDQLIREDSNSTIKDFLELKKEIENVELATELFSKVPKYEDRRSLTKNLPNVKQGNANAA